MNQIAIIAPNFRGSTGYGREFMDANRYAWGAAVIGDCLAAAAWVRNTLEVPRECVGVYGRSYGGFATMLLMGKEPEIFHAGVCHAGLYDFTEFFEVTFVPNLMFRSMGLPFYNRRINEEQSPSRYFESIRGPILITQGELDLGTPAKDAERTVSRLRALGKDITYAFYPGEAHDIIKPDHVLDAAEGITQFFRRNLLRTTLANY